MRFLKKLPFDTNFHFAAKGREKLPNGNKRNTHNSDLFDVQSHKKHPFPGAYFFNKGFIWLKVLPAQRFPFAAAFGLHRAHGLGVIEGIGSSLNKAEAVAMGTFPLKTEHTLFTRAATVAADLHFLLHDLFYFLHENGMNIK